MRIALNAIAMVWMILAGGCAADSSHSSFDQIDGKSAPSFTLGTMNQQRLSLGDLKGKVVLLDFWATWCPPCRQSLPHLQKLAGDPALAGQGLAVVAINEQEDAADIQPFLNQFHYTFAVLQDRDGSVARAYAVSGLPTTVIIGRDGIVRSSFVGYGSDSGSQIDQAIQGALQK